MGYVEAGEDSRSGALRVVQEELGVQLSPAHLRRFRRVRPANLLQHIYLADMLRTSFGVPTLSADVADWMWASKK